MISYEKIPPNSAELRSPEKPIRSINRKAVHVAFALGISAFGLVLYFLVKPSSGITENPIETSKLERPSNKPAILERMPSAYDEIAAKDIQEQDSENATLYQESKGHSQPPPQNYYVPTYNQPMVDERAVKEDAEKDNAERSSIMFASASNAASERPIADAPTRSFEGTPDNGMFFNKKPAEGSNKERFIQDDGPGGPKRLQGAPSRFAVMQGTMLTGVLLTEINSDLPGPILAQITTNIFDSKTGRHLLIPQGSKLIGEYNSAVSHGQKRAQVAWTRLILPNAESVALGRMPGVDAKGASGLQGSVDNHYGDLFVSVLVTSLLSAGVGLAQGPVNPTAVSPQQVIGQSVGQEVGRVGTKMAERSLDVQPTLKVSSGTKINVFATTDVLLKPYSY